MTQLIPENQVLRKHIGANRLDQPIVKVSFAAAPRRTSNMKFSKLQVLSCLALSQLCASTAIEARKLIPGKTAFRDDFGSNMCLQVVCKATVCAERPEDALGVASSGVSLIVGPDCTGWQDGTLKEVPAESTKTTCPAGHQLYEGDLVVYRAWNNVTKRKNYKADFVEWENFKGAVCRGVKDVQCQKDGLKKAPDPRAVTCAPWGL
ncbi:hypothetical protein CTA2_8357 [Colletotrichum tanaceti]|uniref:Uncharacterized protein n=1 Tax=Colletotrichum tanaceti TaxID=1306861 RepID=A0A4V6DFG3_9PEZI|nr:hypothetical protein CTA2_8357 [Colletotrichum tanaceti]TKW49016.1 hypothetical protein CTA1_12055 [Colletotrichum tanaceti]